MKNKPLIYKKFIDKKKCICTHGGLENEIVYLY